MHAKFQSTGQDGVAEFHQQGEHHHGHRLPVHTLGDGIVQGIESHHHGLFARTLGNAQGQRQLLQRDHAGNPNGETLHDRVGNAVDDAA